MSSIWIQLITCLPFPKIVEKPNRNGFLNSGNAPPSLLRTTPERSLTRRLPRSVTGSILASHCRHVVPKKSSAAGSSSLHELSPPAFSEYGPSPYQPMPEALMTALTWFEFSLKAFTSKSLLLVLLSIISFFLFDVHLFARFSPA